MQLRVLYVQYRIEVTLAHWLRKQVLTPKSQKLCALLLLMMMRSLVWSH